MLSLLMLFDGLMFQTKLVSYASFFKHDRVVIGTIKSKEADHYT